MNEIASSFGPIPSLPDLAAANPLQTSEDGVDFQRVLTDSLKSLNETQKHADHSIESMFTGEDVNPAEVLTAVQKADLAFRLTMQVRNKMIQAFQEIQNIQI